MGQQQLLIVVVGVVTVGIVIIVGINVFSQMSIASNKDAIMQDFQTLAEYAYGYKIGAISLGGGGGEYGGFRIPPRLQENENARYEAQVRMQSVTFTATSTRGFGKITAELDNAGCLRDYVYTGHFEK